MQKKFDSFNDGIIYFYYEILKINDFGARINIKSKEDLEYQGKYFYREENIREQDLSFANSIDRKITQKVSIPINDKVKNNMYAIINGVLYSIVNVDKNKVNNRLYVLLEEVRKLKNG